MNKTILIFTLFLTGCSPFDEYECIDGVIYTRMGNVIRQSGTWANTKCVSKGQS
jgi:hypothetical protein